MCRIKKLKVSDMARDDDTRVIGYFAYTPPMHAICDGDTCIIAGSEAGMKRYVEAMVSGSLKGRRIKKTRFGEILKGTAQRGERKRTADEVSKDAMRRTEVAALLL